MEFCDCCNIALQVNKFNWSIVFFHEQLTQIRAPCPDQLIKTPSRSQSILIEF